LLLLAITSGLPAPALAEHSVLVLSSRDSPVYRQVTESFQATLRAEVAGLEFVSLTLKDDSPDQQEKLESFRQQGVDLVFALGSRATKLAAERFPERPVVATMVLPLSDLQALPNVTGVALEFPVADQIQWMRRLLPGAHRIGVLYDPARNQEWVDAARRAADKEGLTLVPIAVKSARELPVGLKRLARDADVLWAISDKTVFSSQTLKQVLLSSFRNKIPVVGLSRSWVKAGAFYALDRDYQDLGRQNGVIARRLLAGTSAEKIAPETPGSVVYLLNLKTARHMKREIGDQLVAGAAKVYK
jgi:putative ABC transport system substrate-binding protein